MNTVNNEHDITKSVDDVHMEETRAGIITDNADHLHRRLSIRQIQLLAIGGSIGTGLFINIGNGLRQGGPLSLLLGFSLYSLLLGLINNGIAEMTVLHPVAGGFVRLAGKWVDDAFGFMAGWNFFFYEALGIPFEITAVNVVLSFWRDDIPIAAVCSGCILIYFTLNILAVRVYGEAEFWLSGGKVALLAILYSFTFVTMVGGNPQHDAYGFRYWHDPGPMSEFLSSGSFGKFQGFLSAVWSACFAVVGPEFVSMAAAEAKHPRVYIKTAFKTIYWRFGVFFILGALCVGVVIPYNDTTLVAILSGSEGNSGTAAASPYVIAMNNMKISVLPHLTNALLVTSIFAAGNTYMYCATRTLYSLALEGRAPSFLTKCTKQGVPIFCVLIVICFAFLSFLQISDGSANALTILTSLITGGGLINYITMCVTYIFFHRACRAQGVDRRTFPYYGRFQPYCAWIGLVGESIILLLYGYSSFTPWDVSTFFSYYTMAIIAPVLFTAWKIIKHTRAVKPLEADLTWDRPITDAYEAALSSQPVGFWTEMCQMVGLRRRKPHTGMD
ncbi:hypothetical protein AARAC_003112 [Aspergillus arachidicola]|uniref:Amino acid permease/ SLC12A domain-containing protein n=1 Tax=Aspergillus arachidicola TaxID=656916 RepID=A0A2G7FQD1_9EURO|nr:hypothetical protein AARAC_003112 [Aspergillus arachidicola]